MSQLMAGGRSFAVPHRWSVRPVAESRFTPLRILFLGTYTPRRCGIATFTNDLATSIRVSPGVGNVEVVALNDQPEGYDYPQEVSRSIDHDRVEDYSALAEYINGGSADVLCLQHEYGIFGGTDGDMVLDALVGLEIPVVTTLHTVLRQPSRGQKLVAGRIAALSDRIIVMSRASRQFLIDSYEVDPSKIVIIPHGVPNIPFADPETYKAQLGLHGRAVILTFGLLSPDKGIENVIRALPGIVGKYPDVVYLVLGATHPNVRRGSGESYRDSLKQLADDLGVSDHVKFEERYVELDELSRYLSAADLYVTPYLKEEQIASGTLAYAMAAGKAIISTPYFYAAEMLAEARGRLVPFANHAAIADSIDELLGDDRLRNTMRTRAFEYTRPSVWSQVARLYTKVFREAMMHRPKTDRARPISSQGSEVAVLETPALKLDHLLRLTDDIGIMQHATYFVPNRLHGYCTDDNARALMVSMAALPLSPEKTQIQNLIVKYLSFVQHAFDPSLGRFRNFMGYDRRWAETFGSPDSNGRAIWATGVAAAELDDHRLRRLAAELLRNALPHLETAPDLRTVSFVALGLDAYLRRFGDDLPAAQMRRLLAERILRAYKTEGVEGDWPWFEPFLTYANARLPHALLTAGIALERDDMLEAALTALRWLVEVQTEKGRLYPVGNLGWYQRGGDRARFDQQPLEAEALIAACVTAFRATDDPRWLDAITLSFEWFLGRNDSDAMLFDAETGGCRDGLHDGGVNENQGAESTLAWLKALSYVIELQNDGVLHHDVRASAPLRSVPTPS